MIPIVACCESNSKFSAPRKDGLLSPLIWIASIPPRKLIISFLVGDISAVTFPWLDQYCGTACSPVDTMTKSKKDLFNENKYEPFSPKGPSIFAPKPAMFMVTSPRCLSLAPDLRVTSITEESFSPYREGNAPA